MHPDIQQLKEFYSLHRIEIHQLKSNNKHTTLNSVEFTFREYKKMILIVDEYKDLKLNNPLLNLVLVLKELSFINESTDFLDWCSENEMNASSEELRRYYIDILPFVKMVKTHFENGKINYFISDLDFQLNAGAIRSLRS